MKTVSTECCAISEELRPSFRARILPRLLRFSSGAGDVVLAVFESEVATGLAVCALMLVLMLVAADLDAGSDLLFCLTKEE